MPQQMETMEPDSPKQSRETQGVTEKIRDEEDQSLHEAKELFREHREEAAKTIQEVVDAKHAHEKQQYHDSFSLSPEFAKLFKEPAIKTAMEMYKKGNESVKSYIYRELCEMLDKATVGKPEQYVLRREFFHLTPNEVPDGEDRTPKTPEAFEKALQERGLSTLGTANISDYSSFIDENKNALTAVIARGIEDADIEEWITNGSEPFTVEWAQHLLNKEGSLFHSDRLINTLRQLYQRSLGEERDNGAQMVLLQAITDITARIPLPTDHKNPLLHPDYSIVDAVLMEKGRAR